MDPKYLFEKLDVCGSPRPLRGGRSKLTRVEASQYRPWSGLSISSEVIYSQSSYSREFLCHLSLDISILINFGANAAPLQVNGVSVGARRHPADWERLDFVDFFLYDQTMFSRENFGRLTPIYWISALRIGIKNSPRHLLW